MATKRTPMRTKPSLDEFRTGPTEADDATAVVQATTAPQGADAPAIPSPAAATAAAGMKRTPKTIRIRRDYADRLKDEAYYRSKAEGRVTESDILDEALGLYWAARAQMQG